MHKNESKSFSILIGIISGGASKEIMEKQKFESYILAHYLLIFYN